MRACSTSCRIFSSCHKLRGQILWIDKKHLAIFHNMQNLHLIGCFPFGGTDRSSRPIQAYPGSSGPPPRITQAHPGSSRPIQAHPCPSRPNWYVPLLKWKDRPVYLWNLKALLKLLLNSKTFQKRSFYIKHQELSYDGGPRNVVYLFHSLFFLPFLIFSLLLKFISIFVCVCS